MCRWKMLTHPVYPVTQTRKVPVLNYTIKIADQTDDPWLFRENCNTHSTGLTERLVGELLAKNPSMQLYSSRAHFEV